MKYLLDFLGTCVKKGMVLPEKEIMSILHKSAYDVDVCKVALPLLKTPKLFMDLLDAVSKCANPDNRIALLLPHISLKDKNTDELLKIATTAHGNGVVYRYICPALEEKAKLLSQKLEIMKATRYNISVVHALLSQIKLSEYKEKFIYDLVVQSGYNYSFSHQAMQYLSPRHALDVIVGNGYNDYLSAAGVLRMKNREEIINVINRSRLGYETCKNAIPKLSEKQRMELMLTSKQPYISLIVIPTLQQKRNIALAFELYKDDMSCRKALIPHCKDENQVMQLFNHFNHDKEMQKVALSSPVVKGDDQILSILSAGYFEQELLKVALKKFDLRRRNKDQLWELMKKSEFDDGLCIAVIPWLKLKKKPDEELMQLLKIHNFPVGLCTAMVRYIKDEAHLVTILNQTDYKSYTDELIKKIAFRLQTETMEKYFLTSFSDNGVVEMVKYIKNTDVLMEKLSKNHYNEKLCKAITEALS